jgi:hypothetical protein
MAITSGVVTVSTTAIAIDTSSPNPFQLILHNESATNTITLGNSTLTANNGLGLHANETITLNLTAGDQLHAIASSGSHTVSWMKIY